MAEPRVEENKLGKYLVFDERKTNLNEIIISASRFFRDIDHNELYFEPPDYGRTKSEYHDLILSQLPKTHFIKYEDGDSGAKIYPYRTLAQVTKAAVSYPDFFSFSRVELLWYNGELCMHITVDKTDAVECGKVSS